MASQPTIPPIPPATFVDANGRLTREAYRFLLQLNQKAGEAADGEVATPAAGGLEGGGLVSSGISLSISDNGVSNAMIRQSQPYSVIGRYAGSVGNVGDIQAVADDTVLGRFAGQLEFRPVSLVPATVADGDYGDITVTLAGTVWTIDAGVVTYAKLQTIATDTLIGRDAAGTGTATAITVGGGIEFTGANALQTSAFTGDATKTAGGTALTLATVNANVGTFGSATQAGVFTVNAKGLITAASNVTITPAASSITGGAALTRVDDTNVTLVLGGSPTTALLAASSLTLGWTGTLAVARGGTGAGSASGTALDNITGFASAGIMARTGAGAYSFRTITGTANQVSVSNGDGVAGNPTLSLPATLIAPGSFSATTTLSCDGNATLGDADGDSHVINGTVNIVHATTQVLSMGSVATLSRSGATGKLTISTNADDIELNPTGGDTNVIGTLQCDSFRIDQTPTAEVVVPTHTLTLSLNGTTYRVPCLV